MKAFLKVLLLLVVALVAIKLLPVTIGLGFAVGFLLVGFFALGMSLVAGAAVLAIFLGIVLSPIWIPIALLCGLVAVIRKSARKRIVM